jgi:hypothetical protein
MLIRMTSSRLGSPDGIVVHQYVAGEVYDLSGSLLDAFLSEKWCEPVVARSAAVEAPAESAAEIPVAPLQPPRPRQKYRKS